MNFLSANTINHRRVIMLVGTIILGVLMTVVAYKTPLTFRDFIFPPIVGLVVFELLFRTKQHLRPITLPLYIVIVLVISEILYGILYSASYGSVWSPVISFQYLLEFPYNLYALLDASLVAGLAYFLIKIYRIESWIIPEQQSAEAGNESAFEEKPTSFSAWIQKYKQQIIGFIGWYLIATVLSMGGAYGLITTPVTVIFLIVFARSRQSKGVAGGILVAVGLNFFVALVKGLSLNAWCLIPFYNGTY